MVGPAPASLGNNTGPPQQKSSSGKEVIAGFGAKHGFFRPPLALSPFCPPLTPSYQSKRQQQVTLKRGEWRAGAHVQAKGPALPKTEAVAQSGSCLRPDKLSLCMRPWQRSKVPLQGCALTRSISCLCRGAIGYVVGRGTFAGYVLVIFPIPTYTLTLTPRRS